MVNKNSQNKDKATLKQSQGMNQANLDALFNRMADKYGTSNLEVAFDDENDQTQPIFEITHEDSSDVNSSPSNSYSEGVSPSRESRLKEGTDFSHQMLELPNSKVSKQNSFVMKQRESETKVRVNSIVQLKISSLLSKVKNNNEFSKAKQRWLWAFQKIKTQLRTKSLLHLNTISFAVGQESDQNDNELQVKNESSTNEEVDTLKIEKQIKMNVKAFFNMKASCVKRKVTNLGKKVTLKASAQLEDENVKQLRQLNVGSRMSLGMLSKEPPQLMQVDEYVALVHCMNLIINNMHQMALVCIETKLSKLNTCSVLFTANLKRIQAFCCMTNFLEALNKLNETQIASKMQRMNKAKSIPRQSMSVLSDQSNELVADFKEIQQMLQKSLKSFKEIKCMWGMGLVKFQKAFLLKTLVERYLLGDGEQVNQQVSLVLAAAIGNLEVVQEKCKHEFECAFHKFNAISHLRGMALSALSIVSNKSHSKFANEHEDQEHQSSFESEELSSDVDEMADKQNHGYVHDSQYSQAYKTAIQQFYKEQRTVERDCCITRKQGEDFSLLTEICKSAQAKPLFEVGLSRQIHVSDGDKATEQRRRNTHGELNLNSMNLPNSAN